MKRLILENLIQWKNSQNRKPLILKGARQVGKTFILNLFGEQFFAKTHYFNFERRPSLGKIFEGDLDPPTILNALSLSGQIVNISEDLIIFDEIQNCPRALTALKYFKEEMPELAICSAGSLLGTTLNEESFPVGQVEYLWLGPLTFEEFLLATQEKLYHTLRQAVSDSRISSYEHDILLRAYKTYSVTGGMPEVVSLISDLNSILPKDFARFREIQRALVNTYLGDFSKHAGKINATHIARVFQDIPAQLSKNIDGSSKRYVFKDVIRGKTGLRELEGPIEWLVKAGLVYKSKIINRADIPLESFSSNSLFKLYIFDIGILGQMLDIPPARIIAEDYGLAKGFFAENLSLQQLIKSDSFTPYCYQYNQSEIEFVELLHGKPCAIEVKSGNKTRARSLRSYVKKYSPDLAIKLTKNNFSFEDETRVLSVPLYLAGFLEELDHERLATSHQNRPA